VLSETVDLCRKAVHAGVSWITVHGRTPSQRSQPVNTDAIKLLADTLHVPVVANGDIKSVKDAALIQQQTGVSGE
jgi:tRNA-dihydrouridine synthase 4